MFDPLVLFLQEALATISEFSEAGITVRGSYFPHGKEPKEGERKLYLAIEATSELAISKAKAEIIRLIKEELIRLVFIHFHFLLIFMTFFLISTKFFKINNLSIIFSFLNFQQNSYQPINRGRYKVL